MREDTKEIAELLDRIADLCEMKLTGEELALLSKITKLLIEWAERHLSS